MADQVIDQQIRERFAAGEAAIRSPRDPLPEIRVRMERRRHRRHLRVGLAAIGCVVLVVSGVVAWRIDRGPAHRVKITANPTVPIVGPLPVVTAADGVETLPAPPLEPRSQSAVVWTGKELVVWGGSVDVNTDPGLPSRAYKDGAAYDPVKKTWRVLTRSPLPASLDPPVATMTGRGLVIVRGSATALWDPTTNEWRKLGDAPASCDRGCWRSGPVKDLSLVGDSLVSYSANAILDVSTGRWSTLADPPRHFERFAVASTGQELVVVGGDSAPVRNTGALAYEPATRAWRQLPAPPDLSQQAIAADWDGGRVVAIDYEMHAAAYAPATNSWSTLPSVPARFYEFEPSLRSTHGASIATTAQAIAVLGAGDRWTPVPYGDVPVDATIQTPRADTSTKTDRIAFAIGIDHAARMSAAAIDLDQVVAHPTRLQVGVASIALPAGYALHRSSYEEKAGGLRQTVQVQIDEGHGPSCTITSTYGQAPITEGREPVTIPGNGGPTNWYRTSDGTNWEAAATTTDTIAVACPNSTIATQLAESAQLN